MPPVSPHTLPAVHAHHLVELVQRWHVEPAELLAGLNIAQDTLMEAGARLTLQQYEHLVGRAKSLTGEPGIGIYFGFRMRLASHGFLGFAAMTSRTLGEALDLAVRFAPTRTSALSLRVAHGDETTALIIEENGSFGAAQDAILFALSVGIWEIARGVTAERIGGRAEFAFERPHYVDRFASTFDGIQFSFGARQHRLLFETDALELPVLSGDPAAFEMARQQCERELSALGYGDDVVARLRAELPRDEGGYHSLQETSRQMGLSERTLKRRLAAAGTSFSSTLDEMRCEAAVLLLQENTVSYDDIAARLGYSDASAFGKAFRRWTGSSPAVFQKARTAGD